MMKALYRWHRYIVSTPAHSLQVVHLTVGDSLFSTNFSLQSPGRNPPHQSFCANPAVQVPDLHNTSPKMKPITTLAFIAITICPALSKPRAAAMHDVPKPAPLHSRSGLLPYTCSRADTLVQNQVNQIEHLQSSNLPVPPDLAGYVYAVEYGRRIAGCPPVTILSANGTVGTSDSSSKEGKRDVQPGPPGTYGDACATHRALVVQVTGQMDVLRMYNIPIAPFLAGWWLLTKDLANILQDGGGCLNVPDTGVNQTSMASSP